MLNSEKDFKIDSFQPKYLKQSIDVLDKHLKSVQDNTQINDKYKKSLLKEINIWQKIKHTLHLD